MPSKQPSIPGFTPLTDQIFLREPEKADGPGYEDHPGTVIVYGWGDGLPKHVAKYAEGFRAMYPYSRQFIVLSPIFKAIFTDLQQRSENMKPLVEAAWPQGPNPDPANPSQRSYLIHIMSNTGGVNLAATMHAFKGIHGPEAALPHSLLVMDSTPGGTNFTWGNLGRWSRAMALGTAARFPWPFALTQGIWGILLMILGVFEKIRGRESAGAWSRKAINDESYTPKSARKLYLYSKEDDLIAYEDIEVHAAETRQLGWEARMLCFEGSGHVGHLRKFPEQYWRSIMEAWQWAIGTSK